jgi:hypothetical protein
MRKHLFAVAAIVAATPQVASAERPGDHAWIDVGGFLADVDSHLRIDNQNLDIEGTHVDFEHHLGLDSNRLLPKVSAGIRIGSRFRVEADYFRLSREARITLTESLTIDDTVFPVSADVHTEFDTNIYRVAVGYSLIRQDKAELGISAGVHATKAEFRIEADAVGQGLEEHRSKFVPLPNVGLYGNVDLFGPIALQGSVDAFKLKAGDYKGSLLDGQLALEARLARHFGVGLGYRYAVYRVKADKHDWRGKLTYDYSGPVAYLELAL